jgi:hypothetical protein
VQVPECSAAAGGHMLRRAAPAARWFSFPGRWRGGARSFFSIGFVVAICNDAINSEETARPLFSGFVGAQNGTFAAINNLKHRRCFKFKQHTEALLRLNRGVV